MSETIYELRRVGSDALTVGLGESPKTISLPFLDEFTITRVSCKLISGTNRRFKLELMNDTQDEDLDRVMPTMESEDNVIERFASVGQAPGWSFKSVHERRIFVKITTYGQTDENKFGLVIGGFFSQ